MKSRSFTGALAALVCFSMLAAACGESSSPTSPTNPTNPTNPGDLTTIFITNGSFSPNPLTINAGTSVNWKNNDSIEHSATFDNGGYESGNIPALSAHDVPIQMNTKGTFTFYCRLHPNDRGSIVVR